MKDIDKKDWNLNSTDKHYNIKGNKYTRRDYGRLILHKKILMNLEIAIWNNKNRI